MMTKKVETKASEAAVVSKTNSADAAKPAAEAKAAVLEAGTGAVKEVPAVKKPEVTTVSTVKKESAEEAKKEAAPAINKAPASDAKKAAEVKKEAAPESKKAAAPAAKEVKKEAAPKKVAATAKKAVKKAVAAKKETGKKDQAKPDESKVKVAIEFDGKQVMAQDILEAARKAYAETHEGVVIKSIEIYVKPEESVAYYVVNGEGSDEYKVML